MKKILISFFSAGILALFVAFTPVGGKFVTKTGHISFYSHTEVEDITANNYKVVSTLNAATGEVVFSVPMQSFEFEKALMQKHYNSEKFLDTKTYPKAKLTGKITNLSAIDFKKNGTYTATVEGELEMHGVTRPLSEKGSITVKGSEITVDAKVNITLADYKIAFADGKPSTNIAKTIEATIHATYAQEN